MLVFLGFFAHSRMWVRTTRFKHFLASSFPTEYSYENETKCVAKLIVRLEAIIKSIKVVRNNKEGTLTIKG